MTTNKKCKHNRRNSNCKDCGGSNLCAHGKQKWCCMLCSKGICEHQKLRRHCWKCSPKSSFLRFLVKAKSRKMICSLSFENWLHLVSSSCSYCGSIERVGVDRVDSKFGYVFENCLSCCEMCNFMKRAYSKEVFLAQVKKIADYQSERL